MAHIIVPAQHRSDGSPFLGLTKDPRQEREATAAFVRILSASFDDDVRLRGREAALRGLTISEQRRRAGIMARWYRDLRGMGHGHIRAMDELAKALRAELDGLPYTPPERNRLWAPGGTVQ